ncbi:MAG: aldo/keto reductase, partial [Bacteroidales bacterium]|nr:aldo/keto reductase [Bacteroidales bacterium]
ILQSKIRLDANELTSRGKGQKGAEEIKNILYSKLSESLKALNAGYIDIMLYHDASEEDLLFHDETMKFFSEMKKAGVIRAHGFSTHNDLMNLSERNNSEGFYDIVMLPFNHKGSFIHSVTGRFEEWDQNKLMLILEESHRKGIGVVAMKTCSGGKYSPSPGSEPSFRDAVSWVLQHEFISAAAIAMASFEQVDDHMPVKL